MDRLPWQMEREILLRQEAETDPTLGCMPEERTTEELLNFGVICLNKPKGPTSPMTVDYIKKILKLKKAGHGGALDPGVTGVLPVATERATRIMQSLLKAGKEYVCIMHLHKDTEEERIRKVAEEFKGKISQLPPVRSAVKRQMRERNIYYFDLLEIEGKDILFKVGCQAGTYVRKICHDFGQKLGTGAHMAELIRTKAGPFTDEEWVTLQDLEDAYAYYKQGKDRFLRHCIKPAEFGVKHLAKIWVQDSAVDTICHGATLKMPGVSKLHDNIEPDEMVAVMTLKDEIICLGRARKTSAQLMEDTKGIAVKPESVLMKTGTYSIK